MTDFQKNVTLLRAADLTSILKTSLRTHDLDHYAMSECVFVAFFVCFGATSPSFRFLFYSLSFFFRDKLVRVAAC